MKSTISRTLRAVPTLLRIGVAETVAYRAEFIVWMLTTTMPLIMLGLWTTVASEGPFANYTSANFVAYYLAMLVVRNLTGSWVAWQVSEEIRLGTMAMRLLRPIHPMVAFATSHMAAIPFRGLIALPVAIVLLFSSGASALCHDPAQLALVVPSIALAWIIGFSLLYTIGCLAFVITQTNAVATLYFSLFGILSGYLLPLDLMPSWISWVAARTPFPSMLSIPVRLLTHAMPLADVAQLLAVQGAWAAGALVLALTAWHGGLRRFEAVGS
jgi:ABC-2 type transport system permease protein